MDNLKNRIVANVKVDQTTGCWNWGGLKNKKGYGRIKHNNTDWRAHRLSYTIYNGEITDGLFVCHSCDNPSCVNPDHLFLGTHQVNMKDANEKGRRGYRPHPSLGSYTRGCRCDECKAVVSRYHKERYQQKNFF